MSLIVFVQQMGNDLVMYAWALGMLFFSIMQLRDIYADKKKKNKNAVISVVEFEEPNRVLTPAEMREAHYQRTQNALNRSKNKHQFQEN